MRVPLIVAEPNLPEWLTGWGTIALVIVTLALVIATIVGFVYATYVRPRLKISATCDSARKVKVEISNNGKDAIQIHRVDFAARGWWAARMLRRLLFHDPFEPVMSTVTATPSDVREIAPGTPCEWRIDVPTLSKWTLPPSLLHPLSTVRRGTLSERRLVLRINRGQNHRELYLWYKRYLPIRKIKRVSRTFAS